MQSINSLKKSEVDISLYYKSLTNNIFKSFIFVDLMNKLIQDKLVAGSRFAIYTDINVLTTNILVPVFHTMYLGSTNHNVILENSDDLWLIQTFTNNKYFIIPKEDDDFDYTPYNVTKIQSISEIIKDEVQ